MVHPEGYEGLLGWVIVEFYNLTTLINFVCSLKEPVLVLGPAGLFCWLGPELCE